MARSINQTVTLNINSLNLSFIQKHHNWHNLSLRIRIWRPIDEDHASLADQLIEAILHTHKEYGMLILKKIGLHSPVFIGWLSKEQGLPTSLGPLILHSNHITLYGSSLKQIRGIRVDNKIGVARPEDILYLF